MRLMSINLVAVLLLATGCFSLPKFEVPPKVNEDRLQRAVAHNPENIHAHFLMGRAALQRSRPSDAIRHFERVLELDDSFEEAWHGIGIALLDKRDSHAAAAQFEKMGQRFPQSARAAEGSAAAALQRGDMDAAKRHATTAIERNPSSAEGFRLRGEAHYADADYAEALADWKRAVEIHPSHGSSLGPIVADLEKFLAR